MSFKEHLGELTSSLEVLKKCRRRRMRDMQQSKEQRVHGVFEKIYKNYDQMNSVISFSSVIRHGAKIR